MSTLFYTEPELVIALNRKVLFLNPNDLQIFKEVELPKDLTEYGLKVAISKDDDDNEDNETVDEQQKKSKSKLPVETPSIQNVCLSPDHQLLAITTSGQKALLTYQCRPENAKLIAVRSLPRASSALAFGNDSKTLLVTDKTGDCYEYNCLDLDAPPRLLLGHLSIVYDVLWTMDTKYIITCDRDDKIRVTNYPDTHEIHGYCLGHKEFVSGLAWLQGEVLASVSGDKTLRLWNYKSGEQLAITELPAPGIRFDVRRVCSGKFHAAVLLHQPNECVGIYECAVDELGNWTITEIKLHSFPEMIANNLCFANERLYVAGIIDEHFTLKVADVAEIAPSPQNWLQMVEQQFEHEVWKPEDVSVWFKKHYDNVSNYLQRKRRRIDEKCQK